MSTTQTTEDIAALGDIHLAFTIWERQRHITGDSQLALNSMVATLVAAGIKHFILAGDIFDTAEPHPALAKMFREFIESCAEAGIQLYYIQGNHDRRVLPWPTAISGQIIWIGDGTPVTIAGRTVVGFDYQNRDAIAESLAKLGASGVGVDLLVMHQAAKQYLDIEGCWNLDLEWVPDNVKEVFIGDIHEPWSQVVNGKPCWYTGASHTRSITEAKHPKSILVKRADDGVDRLPIDYRPIRAFGIDATTKDSELAEIRNWLAHNTEAPLPPVVYLTYDVEVSAAPELVADLIKSIGLEAFVVARATGGTSTAVEYDVSTALEGVPSVQEFVGGFFKPEERPFEHGLAIDLLDGSTGKDGIVPKIELARARFLQQFQGAH